MKSLRMAEEYWERSKRGKRSYGHIVVDHLIRQRMKAISQIIDLSSISSVVDIGAGNGLSCYGYLMYCNDVVATDITSIPFSALQHSTRDNVFRTGRARCFVSNAECLAIRDQSFDIVNSWDLLHHTDNHVEILREMRRVSKRYVVLLEPNALNPLQIAFGLMRKEERGTLKFTPRYLRSIVKEAGLNILINYECGILLPNMTPKLLLKPLSLFPYRIPFVGFSQLVICSV